MVIRHNFGWAKLAVRALIWFSETVIRIVVSCYLVETFGTIYWNDNKCNHQQVTMLISFTILIILFCYTVVYIYINDERQPSNFGFADSSPSLFIFIMLV